MTAPRSDLSVIIVSFNTRELTLACVQSVFAAMGDLALEVIVVDNASTDETVAALRATCAHVRIIANSRNLGFARGNNAGLAATQGRYLLALNSDTLVQPGALRALVNFMDAHLDAGACGPMLLNEDGSLQPSGRPLPSVWRLFVDMTKMYRLWQRDVFEQRGRDYNLPARIGEVSGAALLIRRGVYERVGGFDEKLFAYYEDVDLCKRIGDAGYAIYYVPDAKIIHLWKRSSRATPEQAYRAGQISARYYFRKHHGPLAQAAVQTMLLAKEVALVVVNALQGRRDAVNFHRRMLRHAFAPLP
jgi:GT2 family glycosyltransferase